MLTRRHVDAVVLSHAHLVENSPFGSGFLIFSAMT
jgi:hypothetical protein